MMPRVELASGTSGPELQRSLQRLDGGREVPLLRMRLSQQHAQLRRVAVRAQELREHAFRVGGPIALDQGHAVRECERGVRLALRIVPEELGRLGERFGVEPGQGQHAPQSEIRRLGRHRARERPRRLVELAAR
jgi:hypothetical protein